jgi:hypothetical protein
MICYTGLQRTTLAITIGLCVFISGVNAQAAREGTARPVLSAGAQAAGAGLPLKRITIFSSGIAYYEHAGTLSGQTLLNLPFKTGAVNDALKSLALNDPASANPSVTYQSEQTLLQTLRSLKIDLSDEPDMALILSRLRGAEIEISAPTLISGRILGIEHRPQIASAIGGETIDPWLSLYTSGGIRLFNLKEISSLRFKDAQLNEDLGRALDLIMASRNSDSRNLLVSFPGGGTRQVSVSYVIPAPVWKVSYRLDLGAAGGAAAAVKPLFQGWAIVDNDGDNDWNNVELSLVAGRPASFIQNLYPPYYLSRPTLPLAIAGTAEAAAHNPGFAIAAAPASPRQAQARAPAPMAKSEEMAEYAVMDNAYAESSAPNLAGGIAGAQGSAVGDQFEFTIKTPINLDRRMSAMLPLVESTVEARRLLIFSGANAQGNNVHPRLGAEITNTTGMKLPAGPVTVYDGGTYAGDALIEFWNENEKRLISFGEDLSVIGTVMDTSTRSVTAVKVSGSVMTITRSQAYLKTYTLKNAASQSKQIIIEHPKTPGTTLESPEADEQTPSVYRFTMTLPAAGRELVLMVSEARPISERISLSSLRPESFLSYVTNQEIPPQVRAALQRAVDLRREVSAAEALVTDLENRRASLISDQDRIRRNLEAVGSQTQQGQEYLKGMVSLDAEISGLAPELEKARSDVKTAQKAYEDYLNALEL